MITNTNIKIYVDEREKKSEVPYYLYKLGAYIEYRVLEIGDYVFGSYVIERKRVDDLVRSIYDKRIFEQISRAIRNFDKVFIIIEGSPEKIREYTDRWRSVYGTLGFIAIQNNVSILYTSNAEETAYLIYSLSKSSKNLKSLTPEKSLLRREKKPLTTDHKIWQEYIVQCLPHVGPKLSQKLLETFGSVQRIFNASPSELSRVEGLSEEMAQEIVRIIRSPYNTDRSEQRKTLF
ncbi:MAG: ERCC4 domain-containing protein [Sulfolobales archaeon]